MAGQLAEHQKPSVGSSSKTTTTSTTASNYYDVPLRKERVSPSVFSIRSEDGEPPAPPVFNNLMMDRAVVTSSSNYNSSNIHSNMSTYNYNNPTSSNLVTRPKSTEHTTIFSPNIGRVKKISDPTHAPFIPTHRRVRSGDSFMGNNKPLVGHYYGNSRLESVAPDRFPLGNNSPISAPRNQYQIGEEMSQTPSYQYFASPQPRVRPLYVNIPNSGDAHLYRGNSTDVSYSSVYDKQQYYIKQVNSFMKLNNAIELAEELRTKLENDVRVREKELNTRAAVEKNPTEKDFRRVKEENEYLMKEIRDMQAEMDRYNIPYPGDPPKQAQQQQKGSSDYDTPAFPYNTSGPDISVVKPFESPLAQHSHNSSILTTPPSNKSIPTYENIPRQFDSPHLNELPTFPKTVYSEKSPPPIPPKDTEKWTCSKCTFDNLLLSECEMCGAARPYSLQRNNFSNK